MNDILVSYVVSVYNKEPYIGYTTESLLKQEGNIPSEYIFVDDVSADRSLDIVEERTRGVPNVSIIKNTTNAGPSVRVNQGARLARGKYLQFIDSDDVLAANATKLMLTLIERHQADLIHGGFEKTGTEAVNLVGLRVDDNAPYIVSDAPLEIVFKERFRRMSQMARRDTFLKAGGCDERVFIQDESLGIRLARAAERFILLKAPVLLIPKVENELSRNVSQLNHDRFLAAYGMLMDFPDLNERARRRLYQRCISATWKQHRQLHGAPRGICSPAFWQYLYSNCITAPVDVSRLQSMNDFFSKLKGVRRAG